MGTDLSKQVAGMTAQSVEMFKTTGAGMSSAFTSVGANATAAVLPWKSNGDSCKLQATMSGSQRALSIALSWGSSAQDESSSVLRIVTAHASMLDILEKLKGQYGDTLSVAESAELALLGIKRSHSNDQVTHG